MKRIAHIWLVIAACASVRSEGIDTVDPRTATPHASETSAVIEGYSIGPVREAALAVVRDIAHPLSEIRVTAEGAVLTEGRIGACGKDVTCSTQTAYEGYVSSPWTTIEVRFKDLGLDTDVDVEIEYESCEPGVSCVPEKYASSGELERRILDSIRSRLVSREIDRNLFDGSRGSAEATFTSELHLPLAEKIDPTVLGI